MRDTRDHTGAARFAIAALVAALLLPAAAGPAAALGPEVTLEGTVRVVIADDFEHGRSEARYHLETADGRVGLELPAGAVPDLAGRRARVSGTLRPDGSLRVSSTLPLPAPDASRDPAAAPPAVGAAGGTTDAVSGWTGPTTRHVAVVIASYTDAPEVNGTAEEVMEVMTGDGASVRSFFETASRGRVTVDATVLGPWALPVAGCTADPFTVTADAVVAKATGVGIDLARFDHVIMWTPGPCGGGWIALGEAPGQFIQMSAPYPDDGSGRLDEFANVASHELGHNMGLLHANAVACTDDADDPVALSGACGAIEYGDPFSTMGGDQGFDLGPPGIDIHFVSPLYDSSELAHLGWLDADEEQVVTGAGTFDLVSTYATGDGVRLLRIRRQAPPIVEDPSMRYRLRGGWLTVELRNDPPAGPWDALVQSSPSTAGVIIRYVEEAYDPTLIGVAPALGSTYLVDTVPGPPASQAWDPELHDAPLAEGETFTDPVTGTEITLSSLDAGGATVAVAFPDGPPSTPPLLTAPAITSAVAGDESATVAWSAPTTNGTRPVVGYTVRSYPGGRLCVSVPQAGHSRQCTVNGLANGTAYRFTVTAGTQGGDWRMSPPSDPVTPIGPPKAHVVPLATYLRTQSIAVGWTGHDDGQAVETHDVRYRAAAWNGGFGAYASWRSATTDTAGGLTASTGRTYCFSARSTNDGITGPWSSESCTAVPLDDRSLNESSAWNDVTGSALYRGTGLRTTRQGSSASKAGVEARRIALLVSTCPTCGTLKVYWKGDLKKTVSLRTATSRDRVLREVLSFSSIRTGTLKLVVSTSGKRVQLDGVVVSRR